MNIYDICETNPEKIEEFLLNIVGDKVERTSELSKMLIEIRYLDDKENLIGETEECEILATDDTEMKSYCIDDDNVRIQYWFSFIMITFINGEHIWRVQGIANAEILIKNDIAVEDFDPDEYEEYTDLLTITELNYTEVECDTLYT